MLFDFGKSHKQNKDLIADQNHATGADTSCHASIKPEELHDLEVTDDENLETAAGKNKKPNRLLVAERMKELQFMAQEHALQNPVKMKSSGGEIKGIISLLDDICGELHDLPKKGEMPEKCDMQTLAAHNARVAAEAQNVTMGHSHNHSNPNNHA